ncbi:hypothetical protein FIBSPDRAFT_148881 [Athelia psychrophila]|uniref:Uncharacterized protein n=1 Tax=Athelia psychrophila TaxID=1759441 RepID=A0A166BPR6_9AGAM|nr:hypothetical protein FIBSPDRAFT_148881 [Fibularhizoctonia sp. CBS 109695]
MHVSAYLVLPLQARTRGLEELSLWGVSQACLSVPHSREACAEARGPSDCVPFCPINELVVFLLIDGRTALCNATLASSLAHVPRSITCGPARTSPNCILFYRLQNDCVLMDVALCARPGFEVLQRAEDLCCHRWNLTFPPTATLEATEGALATVQA